MHLDVVDRARLSMADINHDALRVLLLQDGNLPTFLLRFENDASLLFADVQRLIIVAGRYTDDGGLGTACNCFFDGVEDTLLHCLVALLVVAY